MAAEIRPQDAAMAEASEVRELEGTFTAEEIEVGCDEPVTIYGRMQP